MRATARHRRLGALASLASLASLAGSCKGGGGASVSLEAACQDLAQRQRAEFKRVDMLA